MEHQTLSQLGQVASLDIIVRFEEDLSKPGLSNGIILQIEFVKPMERILMRMHIQCVDRQIIGGEVEWLENLSQREFFFISENNNVLWQF